MPKTSASGVAAGVLGGLADGGDVLGERRQAMRARDPGVAEAARAAQRGRSRAADPERDRPGRGGAADPTVDVVELAVVSDLLAAPERAHQRQLLVDARAAPLERGGQHLELLAAPADADAEDEAPPGEHIERGDDLRVEDGIAHRQDHHRRADLDALGDRGDVGEQRQRLEQLGVALEAVGQAAARGVGIAGRELARIDDVVADPERGVARLLGGRREGGEVLACGVGAGLREHEPDLHASTSPRDRFSPGTAARVRCPARRRSREVDGDG